MLDRYVWGSVDRISPEAPVPVLDVAAGERALRGRGERRGERRVARGAGAPRGRVGEDDAGRRAPVPPARARASTRRGVVAVPGRPTTTKTRLIAHSQQLVRADREDARRDRAAARRAPSRQGLAVGDRGAATSSSSRTTGRASSPGEPRGRRLVGARGEGKLVCVDPKESHFAELRRRHGDHAESEGGGQRASASRITDDGRSRGSAASSSAMLDARVRRHHAGRARAWRSS